MKSKNITVIGAGAMGTGIAQVAARAGMNVTLIDISQELVDKAIRQINSRLEKEFEKGRLSLSEKEKTISRIYGTVEPKFAADSDLVIEAVVEDISVKTKLFASLHTICPSETIFATNTSTLSVTQLGHLSKRPEQFIGLHFFNPVHIMRLTEVIPGVDTLQDTVEFGISFIKSVGKVPILVKNCPGFLVNRILLSYVIEAFIAVQEGISPLEIDEKMRMAGFPMGPLELSDMVGIDISAQTFPVIHDAYGERFPYPIIVDRLVKAGRYGIKTGKGFYNKGKIDDELINIIKEIKGELKTTRPSFSAEQLILRQVNEAIYCLQEGIATATDIDRAMVLGSGFPADEKGIGGPLHWADERGLDEVLSLLEDFSKNIGTRFWPHYLLKEYIHAGRLGKKVGRGFFEYK